MKYEAARLALAQSNQWRKSSHSSGENNCVEMAQAEGWIGIRDSKNPTGPVLAVRREVWLPLLATARQG